MGWETRSIPVLKFEFVNQQQLHELILDEESYSGFIFTSPRAVQALHKLEVKLGVDRTVYAVGPATSQALDKVGLSAQGMESGNAEELAHFIVHHHPGIDRPLLFICGRSRRDELPAILKAEGVRFRECIAYDTLPVETIPLSGTVPPHLAVFFSPSGVRAVLSNWSTTWDSVGNVAIGHRTASALHEAGLSVVATATRPSPAGILEAIKNATTAT